MCEEHQPRISGGFAECLHFLRDSIECVSQCYEEEKVKFLFCFGI